MRSWWRRIEILSFLWFWWLCRANPVASGWCWRSRIEGDTARNKHIWRCAWLVVDSGGRRVAAARTLVAISSKFGSFLTAMMAGTWRYCHEEQNPCGDGSRFWQICTGSWRRFCEIAASCGQFWSLSGSSKIMSCLVDLRCFNSGN